jgi:4-azaleucine resistance transporter AzlC
MPRERPLVERRILVRALGIGTATAAYGLSFGALASTAGLSVWKAAALSAIVFTGATQLAAVSVIAAGGSVAGALASGILLSLRNAAYGVAMAPLLRGPQWRRLLGAQLVIDETTAMARAETDERSARVAFWVTGVSVFAFWNASTLVGALVSDALGDPRSLGLDAIFPAAFVVLLAPQLRQPGARTAAVAGLAIAAALVPLAPAGLPVFLASLGVLAGLRAGRAR